MISVPLSESYVFDMLAISAIKAERGDSVESRAAADLEADRLENIIIAHIGTDLYDVVLASPEYEKLYRVNKEMFIRINEMKSGREPTAEDAKYVDDRVFARFKAKQALQVRWFPEQPLTETKHGYKGNEHLTTESVK